MKDFFQEVQVDKVSDKIVAQLEELVQEGKLSPGDKLPSERELIKILGVGRSSLREALNKLETMGYVEIKKRKGIFVKSLDSMLAFDPLKKMMQEDKAKLVQLYEVREDIEVANAYWAALARSSGDLIEIEKCLAAFTTPQGGYTFSWQKDQAFHGAVARATHNFFRLHVVMSIYDFSREFIQPLIEGFAQPPEMQKLIVDQHQAIDEAIKAQDTERAQKTMAKHLAWARESLVSLL